jgi:hypothetical protein
VGEGSFLKLKSASTYMVDGLKFSTNIDSHLADESMVREVINGMICSPSPMPGTCTINIFSHLMTASESDFWSVSERQAVNIFDVLGPNKFELGSSV